MYLYTNQRLFDVCLFHKYKKEATGFIPQINQWVFALRFYKKKYETYFAVEFIILVFVIVFTFIKIFFKKEFIGPESQIVNIGSWFFGLTISVMIPGLVYKGGEGYNLVFNRFTKKEKAFMWFIVELIIGFLIIGGLIWLSHFLFSNFYQYVHLFLIEWIQPLGNP